MTSSLHILPDYPTFTNIQDHIDDLKEQLDRLKRNQSRDVENLEYLKNVILQYMTCNDGDSKKLILKAIAAVLKFSIDEVKSVEKNLSLWWWQAAPLKNNKEQTMRLDRYQDMGQLTGKIDRGKMGSLSSL